MKPEVASVSYFENMVSKPTWKEILMDLISKNKLDPWNIDISALSDAFIKKVKEMKKLDFNMQANVILAAAILLKYKSNYLRFLNYQAEITDFSDDSNSLYDDNIPNLELSSRIPPKRPITLEELFTQIDDVIKYENIVRIPQPKGTITETIQMDLPDYNLEKDTKEIIDSITNIMKEEQTNFCLFSKLVKTFDTQKKIYSLLCLLYLFQEERIELFQEKIFDEIFIRFYKSQKSADTDKKSDIKLNDEKNTGESTSEESIDESEDEPLELVS